MDESYATHYDKISHTGGIISMGQGIVYGTFSKQKINTKSSTESELVGDSDYIPWTLWEK